MSDEDVAKAVRLNELGRTGLVHFSGNIYEEFLPQLQGQKAVKVYREMRDNSPIVGAMLFAIEALLRSVDWRGTPVSDDPDDLEAAAFVEECMYDMSHTWEDFISEVLSMLPFGWSFHEIVYKRRTGPSRGEGPDSGYDDGRIGWRKFGFRSQDTLDHWEIDEHGGTKGLWQYPTPSTPYNATTNQIVYIPIEKALLFRTTSAKNNPEGRSILRNAYRPWFLAKRMEEIEAIGAERDLAGMPIAKIPMEYLTNQRTDAQTSLYNMVKSIVTKVKRDEQEGIIWPLVYDDNGNELFKFELLSATGKRSFDTGGIIQRYQQQMAMTTMADFILLGHENVGSFALSSDKTELFAVALGSWLDNIAEVVNRYAIPRLFELNTFTVKDLPRIDHGDLEDPDLTVLAAFIQSLAGAGMPLFPDLELEQELRLLGGLPPVDPEEREKMLAQQQQSLMPGAMPGEEGQGGGQGEPPPPGGGKPKPTVQGPPDEEIAKAMPRNRYFTGSEWRTMRGPRRYKRKVRR